MDIKERVDANALLIYILNLYGWSRFIKYPISRLSFSEGLCFHPMSFHSSFFSFCVMKTLFMMLSWHRKNARISLNLGAHKIKTLNALTRKLERERVRFGRQKKRGFNGWDEASVKCWRIFHLQSSSTKAWIKFQRRWKFPVEFN